MEETKSKVKGQYNLTQTNNYKNAASIMQILICVHFSLRIKGVSEKTAWKYPGWGKSGFTVVHMKYNTVINK